MFKRHRPNRATRRAMARGRQAREEAAAWRATLHSEGPLRPSSSDMLARHIHIGRHDITVDGEPFPLLVADDTITVEVEHGVFARVSLTLLSEHVTFDGSAPVTYKHTSSRPMSPASSLLARGPRSWERVVSMKVTPWPHRTHVYVAVTWWEAFTQQPAGLRADHVGRYHLTCTCGDLDRWFRFPQTAEVVARRHTDEHAAA